MQYQKMHVGGGRETIILQVMALNELQAVLSQIRVLGTPIPESLVIEIYDG